MENTAMEHIMEELMEHYEEGIEELMGAQNYARRSRKAHTAEDKSMYRNMALQEMEHQEQACKAAERLLAKMSAGDPHQGVFTVVWKHLKQHLAEWRGDIQHQLDAG